MVEKALDEIKRGAVEIIDSDKIRDLVEKFYSDGSRFRVKAGFDPTGADLHLGHTVLLQKFKSFQKHGSYSSGFLKFGRTFNQAVPIGGTQTRVKRWRT